MTDKLLPGERQLLLQLSAHSQVAFEKIYHFYRPRLYGRLIKLLKSEPLAREILQDVFLKVWELRNTIDPDKSFRSYLFRIAENKVNDFFRKGAIDRKVHQHLIKNGNEEYSHVEESIVQREDTAILKRAIDSLPPQCRIIFMLCKLEGKSYKEVSGRLQISTSTISNQIVIGTKNIRKYISA